MSKLRSGTSKTKAGPGELVRVALFWKSHCATCSPVYIILYHVTGSCKGPICKKTSNGLIVNQNHAYYYQVQQQLFCSGYKYEDLVLSDLKEVIIFSIKQNSSFSKKYLPKLQNVYDQYLAPELAYPRVALGIPRLGKVLEDV